MQKQNQAFACAVRQSLSITFRLGLNTFSTDDIHFIRLIVSRRLVQEVLRHQTFHHFSVSSWEDEQVESILPLHRSEVCQVELSWK